MCRTFLNSKTILNTMHKKPRTCLESYTHLKKSKIGFRFMIIAHHRALIENLFFFLESRIL